MRYDDEEKEEEVKKLTSWDILREVDDLLDNVPGWRSRDWSESGRRVYLESNCKELYDQVKQRRRK